jgi:hypothetical protein
VYMMKAVIRTRGWPSCGRIADRTYLARGAVTGSGLVTIPWCQLRSGQGPWALSATQLDPVHIRVLSSHFVIHSRLPTWYRPPL